MDEEDDVRILAQRSTGGRGRAGGKNLLTNFQMADHHDVVVEQFKSLSPEEEIQQIH